MYVCMYSLYILTSMCFLYPEADQALRWIADDLGLEIQTWTQCPIVNIKRKDKRHYTLYHLILAFTGGVLVVLLFGKTAKVVVGRGRLLKTTPSTWEAWCKVSCSQSTTHRACRGPSLWWWNFAWTISFHRRITCGKNDTIINSVFKIWKSPFNLWS